MAAGIKIYEKPNKIGKALLRPSWEQNSCLRIGPQRLLCVYMLPE